MCCSFYVTSVWFPGKTAKKRRFSLHYTVRARTVSRFGARVARILIQNDCRKPVARGRFWICQSTRANLPRGASGSWSLFSLKNLQKHLKNFGAQHCCHFFSPKPVLVMTTCFFEFGAGPWRLTLWKSFLLDPVARRDRDPNGRELPTCKYSDRRTILVVWFLFFLDKHQPLLVDRKSESHATRRPSTNRCVSQTHRPDLGNSFWKRETQAFQGFPIAEASQQPPLKCPSKWRGRPPPATSYCFSKFNRGKIWQTMQKLEC